MSLPRVLEPELMETAAEALDYDRMDHRAVNGVFVDDLLAAARELLGVDLATLDDEAPTFDVLDLGTGTAQIPIVLCERCEQVRIMAADAAYEMLTLAVTNVDIAGLRERVQVDQVDAKALHYADALFTAVISNSLVHHVREPAQVLAETVRVCRPGGLIFVRDLLRPDSETEVERLVATYAGQEAATAQQLFRASLHAALRVEEMRELVARLGLDPSRVNATSDRHWTWSARRPLVEI